MRTTCIHRLRVERQQHYDPNFHELINRELSVEVLFEDGNPRRDDETSLRLKLAMKYVTEKGEPFGSVDVEAETRMDGVKVVWTADGKPDLEQTPENVLRLIEGALSEDVLLPVSLAARASHLPSILPIPALFPRKKTAKAAAKVASTAKAEAEKVPG